MSIFGFWRGKKEETERGSLLPVATSGGLKTQFIILEPTKSLLWLTDEDPSKARSPFSIVLTVSLEEDGVKTSVDDRHNFLGEPSLIWKKLPVRENNDLEEKPMYYPSYAALSPEHRYQYLSWLRDVTQQTNLSYVFLYYYGLERHLLVGDFENAAMETLRLLQHHDRGTFRAYAQEALIVATLHRKRLDMFEKYPHIFDGISNETLVMRKALNRRLTAGDIIQLAHHVKLSNKRYLKSKPAQFESELRVLLDDYELKHGSILDVVPVEKMIWEESRVFANSSLPDGVRKVCVPQLLKDERFAGAVRHLLEQAHENVKAASRGGKGKRRKGEI